MLSFPNAKINIGLHILRKRPDHYHDIETFFYPVYWSDILEILPAKMLHFQSSGILIPNDAQGNLCMRAYHLLKSDFDIPNVQIHLHKIIPIGAGLGGGSADAAFTIQLLNQIFQLNLSLAQMQDYARKLGSDCAFFIENKPKYGIKKGDIFENIALHLSNKFIILVYPNLHITTQEAYQQVKPCDTRLALNELLLKEPFENWKNTIVNDFEAALFPKHPILSNIKDKLYDLGAVYASMSGSGSTLFGIFEQEVNLTVHFSKDFQVWQGKLS